MTMQNQLKFAKEVMQIREAQVTSSKEQQIREELWLAKTRGAAERARASAIHSSCLCAGRREEAGGARDPPVVGTASPKASPAPMAA